jgi:hypothetical protein
MNAGQKLVFRCLGRRRDPEWARAGAISVLPLSQSEFGDGKSVNADH